MRTTTIALDRQTLDIPAVAAILGISRAAAYELAKQDRLPVPTIRAGRRLLVSKAALESVLDAQKKGIERDRDRI